MRQVRYCIILLVIAVICAFAEDSTNTRNDSDKKDYRIEKPGTITFTVGIKIEGKVAKPQVVIFLPKEKSQYRKLDFSYSFKNDLAKPLPLIPIIE